MKIEKKNARFLELQEQFHKAHQKQESQKAWDFLAEFKVDAEKVSHLLKLGWADHRFTKSLAKRMTVKGDEQRAELKKCGILDQVTGRPNVYGLTVPLFDSVGNVVNFHSLSLGREPFDERQNKVSDLGMIWNTKEEEIVLVSNVIELIPLYGFGITNAVFVSDVHGEDFLEKLKSVSKITTLGAPDLSHLEIPVHRIELELLKGKSFVEYCQSELFAKDFIEKVISFAPIISGEPNVEPTKKFDYEERNGHYFTKIDDRHYRLTGIDKIKDLTSIKITLQVWLDGSEPFHADSLDLNLAKKRERFAQDASTLGIKVQTIKKDLGKILRIAEEVFHSSRKVETLKVKMSAQQVLAATEYLSSESLFENLKADLKSCDLVGEEALVAYLAGVSRLSASPIPVIAPSSQFIETVCNFFPPEHVILQSSLSAKSLRYLGDQRLEEGILAVTGGEELNDDFYQLLKHGKLRTLSVERDKKINAMATSPQTIEAVPTMFLSEASASDEIREVSVSLRLEGLTIKTKSRSFEALQKRDETSKIFQKHHSIQRMLQPYTVVNEHAENLIFQSPRAMNKELYLRLIDAVCLFRQHQKSVETVGTLEVIRVEAEDIRIANKLAAKIFARASFNDLPQRVSQAFELICQSNEKGESFTRRKLCEWGGFTISTAKNYLDRLVQEELVIPAKGSKGQKFEYQLLQGSLQEPTAIELTVPASAIQSDDAKCKPVNKITTC